jgi:hypothetical protein
MADSFYEDVYSQDSPTGDAHAWIQWKGTDVCMDVHCRCSEMFHVHGEFAYFWRCPECGATFALGQTVKLIPLTADQISQVEKESYLSLVIGDRD